jgi:hypothetical protein
VQANGGCPMASGFARGQLRVLQKSRSYYSHILFPRPSSPEKLSGRHTFHILNQRRGGIGSSIEEARGYNTGAMCHVLTSEDESRG